MDAHAPLRADLYPSLEPYDSGMLPLDDVHTMYWETSGNGAWRAGVVSAWRVRRWLLAGAPPIFRSGVFIASFCSISAARQLDPAGEVAPIRPPISCATSNSCASTWVWLSG